MARALTCFITDQRRTIQSLALLATDDLAAARRYALEDLRANPHHIAVEIYDGDRLLLALSRSDLAANDGEIAGHSETGLS